MPKADQADITPHMNNSIGATTEPDIDKPDIENILHRALCMSLIAVTLAEGISEQKADDLTGRPNTYILPDLDLNTLLFAIYETHAEIRLTRDLYLESREATA